MSVPRELARRAKAIGVTRVARLTGLDRTGVEVASAIRPLGHVLQVSNGKGKTFEEAAATAVSEAAELWAAEHPDPLRLRFGSVEELTGRAKLLLPDSAAELVAPELWSKSTRLGWIEGRTLAGGRSVLVPAQAVFCPPQDGAQLGPSLVRWTTNGLAAHPSRPRAVRHALLEVIERDQLHRALPGGWTPAAVARRMLAPSGRLASTVEALRARGFDAYLFDLSSVRGMPVGGALLFDREQGPIPLTAGYACRLRPEEALLAALLEAAQSRLTDIHGAREDVTPGSAKDAAILQAACARSKPRRRIESMPQGTVPRDLDAVVVDLASAADLHVVKVLVPGSRVSGLL